MGNGYLWLKAVHVLAIAAGVIVLDTGAQMCQVANQTRIFGLVPGARSRLNTVYMTVYFAGAAVGSALATMAWRRWGWNGVCGLALDKRAGRRKKRWFAASSNKRRIHCMTVRIQTIECSPQAVCE